MHFRRAHLAAVLLVAASVLPGCASPFRGLVREDDVPDLAPFRALTAANHNRTVLVETGGPGEPPARVAVHEIGDGTHEWTLILLHGMFTDHTSWRFVQGALAADYDLLVIDLPGCGDSDAPDPRKAAGSVYTPDAVARRVLTAVEERLSHRAASPRLAVVGHSYGGMIAMRMFGDSSLAAEHSDVLGRVERLILLSPVDVSIHRPDPVFVEIATVSPFRLNLGLAFGVVQEKVVQGTICSVCDGRPALQEEAAKRLEILRDPRRRRAMQALLLNAVPTTGDPARPDWDAMEELETGYARVTPPTLILWGRRDETVPIAMGYKIAAQLPHATLMPLDDTMHSIHMERPGLCVEAIRQFLPAGEPPVLSRP